MGLGIKLLIVMMMCIAFSNFKEKPGASGEVYAIYLPRLRCGGLQ